CQSLQARVNRLVGAHRCAGLQRSSVLMQQADGFLIGAMVRGGTRSPTVCTKLGPDAALVPPPRQATTYKRLQPRVFPLPAPDAKSSRLKPLPQKQRPMPRTPHARAALLMIGSTMFFGAMAVTIRLASDALSTYQIAFFRNFFGLLVLLPFLWRSGPSILRTRQLPRYLVRSAIGVAS